MMELNYKTTDINKIGEFIKEIGDEAFVVIDCKVFDLYFKLIKKSLDEYNIKFNHCQLGSTEYNKNYTSAMYIQKCMMANGVSRNTVVVGIGGGIVCDVTAFVASTSMRGMPLVLIPTTLLAMADAAIGGKTGVNFENTKNWVGTFYPASTIISCVQFLETLNDSLLKDGLSEIIKIAVIEDTLDELDLIKIVNRDYDYIGNVAKVSALQKYNICKFDLNDKNNRNCLNFGHTFAHAIESASNFQITHGQAVSIGMVAESELIKNIIALPNIVDKLKSANMPVQIGDKIEPNVIFQYMKLDKKNDGEIKFALPSIPSMNVTFSDDEIMREINKITH